MTRRVDTDTLRALESNAVEAERSEREQVHAASTIRQATPYCHGEGWPVVLLRSVADYDRRVLLSRQARAKN